MITFITGLPGSGKTLLALQLVQKYLEEENKEKTEEEKRQVHYYGIAGLKLDWNEMDTPELWHQLPTGSIIVIDESQKIFPNMANGAKRPSHYTEFQTHRHKGYDVFLITQDATLVDTTVRALANRHIHQSRSYGLESTTQYEWQAVNSTKPYALKMDTDAVKRQWKYPKELYDLYKSAEQHTHKKRIPYRKIIPIVIIGIFGIALITYMLIKITSSKRSLSDPEVKEQQTQTEPAPLASKITRTETTNNKQPVFSDIKQFSPTVRNIPMSAPIYQNVVRVRDYPRVQGCLKFELNNTIECVCDDQQGNRVDMDTLSCISWIKQGHFDFSVSTGNRATSNRFNQNSTTPSTQRTNRSTNQ